MFASVTSKIFSYFLDAYIEEISPEQMEMAIINGNATLTDLQIKKTALIKHKIPIEIVKGAIHRVDLSIPWKNLFSKKSFFSVDEIFILCSFNGDVLLEYDQEYVSFYKELDEICQQENISKEGLFAGVVGKILSKLEMNVSKIHLRVEQEIDGKVVAIGLMIPIINATTIELPAAIEELDVFRKQISIHDLSIYLDTNSYKVDISNFRRSMLNEMQLAKHQYILKDFTFSGIFEHSLNKDNYFTNNFKFYTPGYNLLLDEKQWESIVSLEELRKSFERKRYFFHVGRPLSFPPKSRDEITNWWKYAGRCAFKKVHPKTFDPKKALLFLRSRKEMSPFLSQYVDSTNKEKYNSKIKLHRDFFGPDVFLCLLFYTKYIKTMNERQKSLDLTAEEIKTIIPENQENGSLSLRAEFNVKGVSISLTNNESKCLSTILLSSLKGYYALERGINALMFKVKDFILFDRFSGTDNEIFALKHVEKKNCLTAKLQYIKSKRFLNLNIDGTSPIFNFDSAVFSTLSSFFQGSSIFFQDVIERPKKVQRDSSLLEIQSTINSHVTKKLHITFDSPKVVIPAEKPITVFLDQIEINTTEMPKPDAEDPSTFYEGYQFVLHKFGINVGDKQVCAPFSTEIKFESIFVLMKSMPANRLFVHVDDVLLKFDHESYITLFEVATNLIPLSDESMNIRDTQKSLKKEETSGTTLEASLIFDKFNLVLSNSEGKDSTMLFEKLSAEFLMQEGISFSCQLKSIKGTGGSKQLQLSANGEQNAFECTFSSKNDSEMQCSIYKPSIILSFDYITNLMSFFDMTQENEYISRSSSKQSIAEKVESTFTAKVNIIDPSFLLNFKGKSTDVVPLLFDFSKLGVVFVSKDRNNATIDFFDMKFLYDQLEIANSGSGNCKADLGERMVVSVNMPLINANLDPIAYKLLMELADYLPFFIDTIIPPPEIPIDPEMAMKFTLNSDKVVCNLFEKNANYITLELTKLFYKLDGYGHTVESDTIHGEYFNKEKFIDVNDKFHLHMNERVVDIQMPNDIKVNVRVPEINYIYLLFIDKSVKQIVDYDTKAIEEKNKGLPSLRSNVAVNQIDVRLYNEEMTFSDVHIDEVNLVAILDVPKTHMILEARGLNMQTTNTGEINDFLIIKDKMYFEMVENSIIFKVGGLMEMNYQQQFFLDFVDYAVAIIQERTFDKMSPLALPLFNYIVDINHLKLRMLPRPPITKNTGFFVNLDNIKVTTTEDLLQMNIIAENIEGTSLHNDKMFSIERVAFPLKFVTSYEVPQLTEGYDKSLIEKYSNPKEKYLHSIDVSLDIDEATYIYQRAQAKLMCDAFCTFLDFEPVKKGPFPFIFNIDVSLGKAKLHFIRDGFEGVAEGVKVSMRSNYQKINLKSMKFYTAERQLIADLKTKEGDVLSIMNKLTAMDIDIDYVIVYFHFEKIGKLLRLLYRSPFLLTKWGMTPEIPPPMNVNIKNVTVLLPVVDKDKIYTYLNAEMKVTLQGNNTFFNMKNAVIKVKGDRLSCYPICSGLSFSYADTVKDEVNKIEYKLGSTKLDVSVADITAIVILLEKALPIIDIALDDREKNAPPVIKNTIFSIESGLIDATISQNKLKDRIDIPLFHFSIDPISFVMDLTTTSTLLLKTSSLDFFNNKTRQWDMILEPLFIDISAKIEDQKFILRSFLKNLNVNISYDSMKQSVLLMDNIMKCFDLKSLPLMPKRQFVITNETGSKAEFTFSTLEKKFELKSMESKKFQMIEENTRVFFILDGKLIPLRQSNLRFPYFITPSIVVSVVHRPGEQRMIFSSLLKITNNTQTPLNILVRNKRSSYTLLARIDPGMREACPFAIPNNYFIAIANTPNYERIEHQSIQYGELKKKSQILEAQIANMKIDLLLKTKLSPINVLDIVISPLGTIINHIPEQITIKLAKREEEYPIESGGKWKTNLLRSSTQTLYAACALKGCTMPKTLAPIPIVNGRCFPIPAMTKQSSEPVMFAALIEVNEVTLKTKMYIFAPTIINNLSKFNLTCFGDGISSHFKGSKVKRVYWTDKNFFINQNQKKVQLFLSATDNREIVQKEPIECLGVGSSSQLLLPLSNTYDIFLPLRYTIRTNEGSSMSTIVSISAKVQIKNNLPFAFTLKPLLDTNDPSKTTGHSFEIKPGQSEFLSIASIPMSYAFQAEISDTIIPLSLDSPIHTVFLIETKDKGTVKIEIEAIEKKLALVVMFKAAVLSHQKFMITNELDTEIFVNQKGGTMIESIPPQITTFVGFEHPFEQTDIEVSIAGKKALVSLTDISVSKEVIPNKAYVEVIVNKNNSRTVLVKDKATEEQKNKQLNDISFAIQTLSASLISKQCNEVALLTIKNIAASLVENKNITNINFNAESVELDDLHPLAPFDVVMYGASNEYKFIDLRCEMFSNAPFFTAFKSFSVRMQPVAALIDISFVYEVFDIFTSIVSAWKKNQTIKEMSSSDYDNDIPVSESSTTLISSKELVIHPITVYISVENNTGRPYTQESKSHVPWYFSVIPNIAEGCISLPALPLTDFVSNENYIKTRIVEPLMREGIKQGLKLLFNLDILFNIGGITGNIARSFIEIPSNPIKGLSQLTLGTAFAAGESVLLNTSKLIHFVSDWDSQQRVPTVIGMNQGATRTIKDGFDSLTTSMTDAVKGIVTKPVNGAKTEGVIGFCKGIGNGIFGLVLKPVSGIVDASTGLVSGARKAIDGKTVLRKQRNARVFPFKQIVPFSPELAEMQMKIQTTHENTEPVVVYFADLSRPSSVVITPSVIGIFTAESYKEISIERVKGIKVRKEQFSLTVKKQGMSGKEETLDFQTENRSVLSSAVNFITSRANAISTSIEE